MIRMVRRAAAEALRRLQPDVVLRQEMFHGDRRGHTIFDEQGRALDMQGVLGSGSCTVILFNPRHLNLVRDWSMEVAACRKYWARFGAYREAEALGNLADEQFPRAENEPFTPVAVVA
ncbi:hypothetical protein AB0E21_07120 [Streptomyces sp. NPDC047967]|uniref:hypothetical protein n=1 Tax=Streptomyces sp. NPDC047967 TaxID=3154924 RepID=UPI0033C66F03